MSNRLFSNRELEVPKSFKIGFIFVAFLWLTGVLLSLGVTGVIIWAIIKLVTKVCAS